MYRFPVIKNTFCTVWAYQRVIKPWILKTPFLLIFICWICCDLSSAVFPVRLHGLKKQHSSFGRRTQLRPQRAACVQPHHLLQILNKTVYSHLSWIPSLKTELAHLDLKYCPSLLMQLLKQDCSSPVHVYICYSTYLTVLLRKMISVDSWASAPPFKYNFLTSSDVSEQLRTQIRHANLV